MSILISPRLCRAARSLLNWSRSDLATHSGLNMATVAEYERGDRAPYESTRQKLQAALEQGGVRFLAVGSIEGVGIERTT